MMPNSVSEILAQASTVYKNAQQQTIKKSEAEASANGGDCVRTRANNGFGGTATRISALGKQRNRCIRAE